MRSQNGCPGCDNVIHQPDLFLPKRIGSVWHRLPTRCTAQAEAVALIADSLLSLEAVLADRGTTPLKQLKRWSLKAAAHQVRNRIGSTPGFPSGNWHQNAALRQISLKDCAECLQHVDVVIAPQRKDQPAHLTVVPGGCMPAQWVRPLDC